MWIWTREENIEKGGITMEGTLMHLGRHWLVRIADSKLVRYVADCHTAAEAVEALENAHRLHKLVKFRADNGNILTAEEAINYINAQEI